MSASVGQDLRISDSHHRRIGQLLVEEIEGDLLLGKFVPGADYFAVEDLFRDFEEAVNHQALSMVDDLDAGIDALGLCLELAGDSQVYEIYDVQIWNDGAISCRMKGRPFGDGKGVSATAQSSEPLRS